MDVCTVSLRLRVYLSVLALYGAANALYWKSSERQNSMHLTLLKHQNTKTSLYKLSKNHWVIALFKKIGSVRKRLQSTVSLDHPVLYRLLNLFSITKRMIIMIESVASFGFEGVVTFSRNVWCL